MGLSRLRFLARLARRNALRHKGQTIRAVLGLLVVTVILTMGLGLGESAGDTFERVELQRYGPIDVVLRSQQPIDQEIVDGLPPRSGMDGIRGAATLDLSGAVSNPRTGLAEPEASIRGVSPAEADALGALRHADQDATAPEPGTGEVVISEHLARIIDARIGDTLVLRTQKIGSTQAEETETFDHTGLAGVPAGEPATHVIHVPGGTTHLVSEIRLTGNSGTVTATLVSPTGTEHSNQTTGDFLRLEILAPMEEGEWDLHLTATAPTNYSATTHIQTGPSTPETTTIEVKLLAIVKTEGRAAISERATALIPLQDLQEAVASEDKVNAGFYRVEGDPHQAADALADALPDELSGSVRVGADKADSLDNAKEEGAILGSVVIAMGSFTLIAAILLAYTLFSALVEARRSEIGISRALGLSHREVALSMTIEGGLYGFAAAVVGAAIGFGIILLAVEVLAEIILPDDPYMSAMALSVSPTTILLAVVIGTLIPLVTIGIASLRLARVDPALAIRGLPDDPKGDRRTSVVWAVILILAGLLLFLVPDARPLTVPLVLAGVALVANGFGRPSIGYVAAAVAVGYLIWSLYTFEYREEELEPLIVFASGAVLALGLAALAVASKRPYQAILRLTGRESGARRSAFIGIRYLIARRRPVGLTMAMIALVTLIVTVTGMLVVTLGGTGVTEDGGYAILGEASTAQAGFPKPLPTDIAGDIERVDFLVGHFEMNPPTISRNGQPDDDVSEFFFAFLGVTPGFAASNEFSLTKDMGQRAPGYATDEEAWAAVRDGEGIIVPWWYLENDRLHLGETITLQTGTFGPQDLVVIGGLQSDSFGGWVFMAEDHVLQMGLPQKTEILVRVTDGADTAHIAHRLSAIYAEHGMTFESIEEDNAEDRAMIHIGTLVVEAFLAFGLFVGLSSTGFMASRAVHERRRDIGTLRALGYEERDIRRAFIMESTLTAVTGLVIGIASGLVVAHSIWWRDLRAFGLDFQPPWLILMGISLAVLGIAVLASRGPARRAARLPPALAVRHVE